MSTITLQAALVLPKNKSYAFEMSIPSGTVLTISDALDQDSMAEMLAAISSKALGDNRTQLDRDVAAPTGLPGIPVGNDVHIKYGAHGERIITDYAASSSVSSSTSHSVSSSVSSSASAS
jgi:hypothetical protein